MRTPVFRVHHGVVLRQDVGYDILCAGILAEAVDRDDVRALVIDAFDESAGRFGFEVDAVVAVDYVVINSGVFGAAVNVLAKGAGRPNFRFLFIFR